MEKIKEFYRNITKTGWIIILLIIAFLLFAVFGVVLSRRGIDLWPFNYNSIDIDVVEDSLNNDRFLSNLDQTMKSSKDSVLSLEDVFDGKYKNSYESATVFVRNTYEVPVAVFVDDKQLKTKNKGQLICGDLTFVVYRIPRGGAVINTTIRAIFDDKIATDFEPGNIIPKFHPNLVFDNATLENGIVRIYLKGDFGDETNICNSKMALIQITETVKKFEGVKSIEIYQNLQKIN